MYIYFLACRLSHLYQRASTYRATKHYLAQITTYVHAGQIKKRAMVCEETTPALLASVDLGLIKYSVFIQIIA